MKWYFSKDDCLHITENGKVPDYFEGTGGEPPWQLWKNRIRFLYIEEGITDLGANAFQNMPHLEQVFLPNSLKRIHMGCFSGCRKLSRVVTGDDTEFLFLYHYIDELRKDPLFDRRDGHQIIVFDSNAFYDVPWAIQRWGVYYIHDRNLYTCLHRCYEMRVPEQVEYIGPFAFYGTETERVILPISLNLKIHEDAFSGTSLYFSKRMQKKLPEAFVLTTEDGGELYPGIKRFRVCAKSPQWRYGPRDSMGNVRKEYRGVVGIDAVNGAHFIMREVKKGLVAVGILFDSEKKAVQEVQSIRWSDWNQDFRQYYETPYREEDEYSVRIRGKNAMIFGKDESELEYEFYSSPVTDELINGFDILRYSNPNSHEEWFLIEETDFAYGEAETAVLNVWMKNHPEYQLPEEK